MFIIGSKWIPYSLVAAKFHGILCRYVTTTTSGMIKDARVIVHSLSCSRRKIQEFVLQARRAYPEFQL